MFGSQNLFLSLSTFDLSLMFGTTVFGKLLFSMSLINKYAKKIQIKCLQMDYTHIIKITIMS